MMASRHDIKCGAAEPSPQPCKAAPSGEMHVPASSWQSMPALEGPSGIRYHKCSQGRWHHQQLQQKVRQSEADRSEACCCTIASKGCSQHVVSVIVSRRFTEDGWLLRLMRLMRHGVMGLPGSPCRWESFRLAVKLQCRGSLDC